jgi:multidrug efflux pump subunit AcrB
MKQSSAVHTMCSIVFIFGVLVGTLMHGHIMWHDVAAAMIAGISFSMIRIIQFRPVMKKVLAKFNKKI